MIPDSRLLGVLGILLASSSACARDVTAGGAPPSAMVDPDPLDVAADAPKGSLDALHRDVLVKSCAAQPGLCHSGQFEPNLSTPALAYENLVLRPSLEHPKQHRVLPGHPEKSLLVDKLRDHAVISRMPLGAAPLPEASIQAVESWIETGALRAPGAAPAPVLDNPPDAPRIGVFGADGARVAAPVQADEPLTLRMTVKDFETADADMVAAGFYLYADDGRMLMLQAEQGYSGYLQATYAPAGAPVDKNDPMSWKVDVTIPKIVPLSSDGKKIDYAPSAGMKLTVFAAYADGDPAKGAMIAYGQAPNAAEVAK